MAGIKAEQDLLLGQGTDISKQSADLMQQLQSQQYVSSTTYKSGSLFRKASTTQNMGSLAGKSFADIEQLALQGKLTESAKKLFDELVKLKSEGADVEQALLDAGNAAAELATGTNIDSLSGSIIESLKAGKTGLSDVMSDYSDIIQNALLSTFESEVVKKELAAFYAKLSAAAESDGAITVAEKEALSAEYRAMRERVAKEAEAYSTVTGSSFVNAEKGGSGSGLSGAIKGITETQADLLAGQFGGLRIAQIDGNAIARTNGISIQEQNNMLAAQHLTMIKIEMNTKITAEVIQSVDNTTKSMDTTLKKMDDKMNNNANAAAAAGRGG